MVVVVGLSGDGDKAEKGRRAAGEKTVSLEHKYDTAQSGLENGR